MTEKKPAAGEWWGNANGDLVFIHGRTQFGALIVEEAGTIIDQWDWNWDGWHHEPACTGWDWQPETWPKWYVLDGLPGLYRRDSATSYSWVRLSKDGTVKESPKTTESWNDRFIELTESEALARLNPPLPTCPDCNEPLTDGHADVCPEAWVEITNPEHVPRPGIDSFKFPCGGWIVQRPGMSDRTVGEHFALTGMSHRCRRKHLPPPTEPSSPNLGHGF